MEHFIKTPYELSDIELTEFEALLIEGGEVAIDGLVERIHRAEKLIFIRDGKLLAIGGIKRPSTQYRNKVFKKSRVGISAEDYSLEVGWIYTTPSARGKGLARKIMQSVHIAIGSNKCFATTRENNNAMHNLFKQNGFLRVGKSYKSDRGEYSLVLYLFRPNNYPNLIDHMS